MIRLKVNGASKEYAGDPEMPLLWYLRDVLELTGIKFGCGMGLCGACTVHINGEAARSCLTPMKAPPARTILTIEGLSAKGDHPLQKAWKQHQRAAVRLLPERPDHAGRLAAQDKAQAHRSGHRRGHAGQHLPLRNLSAHSRSHQNWPRG